MRSVTRAVLPILVVVLAVGLVHAAKRTADPYVAGVNGVTQPTPVQNGRIAPVFPTAALGHASEAAVVVSTVVRADGTVSSVDVVDCDHPGYGFENAVRSAVTRWRFQPGTWNGRSVDTVTKFRIRLSQPVELPNDTFRRTLGAMISSGLPNVGVPQTPGMRPTGDPGSPLVRPTAAILPGCTPGKVSCMYEKSPGGAPGQVIEPIKPPVSMPFQPKR